MLLFNIRLPNLLFCCQILQCRFVLTSLDESGQISNDSLTKGFNAETEI